MLALADLVGLAGELHAIPRILVLAAIGLAMLMGTAFRRDRLRMWSVASAALLVGLSVAYQVNLQSLYDSTARPVGRWELGSVQPVVAELAGLAGSEDLVLLDYDCLVCVWNAYDVSERPQLYVSRLRWDRNEPMDFERRWREVEREYENVYLVRFAWHKPGEVVAWLGAGYRLQNQTVMERLEIRHYTR